MPNTYKGKSGIPKTSWDSSGQTGGVSPSRKEVIKYRVTRAEFPPLEVYGTSFHVGENGVLYLRDENTAGNIHLMAFASGDWLLIEEHDARKLANKNLE